MAQKGVSLIKAAFDTDNFLMRFSEKVLDIVTVNLLFVVSCLPIVTIGVAKISLYETMFEIKRSRRVPVFRTYLRAFKQNLKLGLQLGLLELGIVSLSLLDLYLFWGQTALPFQIVKAICLGILIFLTLVMLASYPIAARYDLSWKEVLQKGLILASFNFPWFFLMLAILFLIVMVLYSPFGWVSFYPLWFWFASLSPSRFDGENLRQIPVGWLVSETTFNRYSF